MQEDKKEQVVFKATIIRPVYEADGFGIYATLVDKIQYPFVKLNAYGNASIIGELSELAKGAEYEITATEEHNKYGYQYRVSNIRRDIPMGKEATRAFLNEILTQNQADVLYEKYPDIIERVRENRLNDIDLSQLHGIGEYTFNKIVDKITKNFCLSDIVAEFHGVLTLNMIRKLYNKYTSFDVLKEHLKKEPYKTLTSIDGVGFKTADTMIITMQDKKIFDFGIDIKTSVDRCTSCILYMLNENEKDGNTKMNLWDLKRQCEDLVPMCANQFYDAIEDDRIYYNVDSAEIAMNKTHIREKYIAETIISNLYNKNEWECDVYRYRNVGDIELTDEQLQTVQNLCKYPISILNGPAGCVDCDTEYFNGTEWKKISDFEYGEKVLQYNEDGTAELVYPLNYIKQPAECLWEFKTKRGLNQCLSDSHMCYYITSKGNLYHKTFKEIREGHKYHGFSGRFITTFDYSGSGIDLTDDEIRLMVATFADGSFYYRDNCSDKVYNRARFNFQKERKKKRLIDIAEKLGVNVRIVKSATEGYDDLYIDVPFRAKHYPKEWYNCNKHQLEVIANEVMFWDREYKKNNKYSTTCKEDADFIQFVFTSLGYRATISINDRVGKKHLTNGKKYERKSIEYSVSYTNRTLVAMCCDNRPDHKKTEIKQYKTKDGFEYCFTVPSHLLVLRRGDRIFITGNCGKSASAQAVIAMLDDLGKTYRLMSPTGKAAKVLADFTHRYSSTIHRGLGYNPRTSDDTNSGWIYNEYNKLHEDVVIVDEVSMIDINLFYRLVKAIDFSRTKLLMIGDNAQLPSVGCGNILHDFMESKLIPTVTLTKIFRYSDGGLMKAATDIRTGKRYLTSNMKNKSTVFGNNKDYVFLDIAPEKSINSVIAIYKKLLSEGNTIEDIQVITPKNVGKYGTVVLNNMLQVIANPNAKKKNATCLKLNDTSYYQGDLVIETKNNYKAPISPDYMKAEYRYMEDIMTAFVANGESGIVKNVGHNFLDIAFGDVVVRYDKEMAKMINLGYAITCHKSQGSSINNVILLTLQSDIFMLNSNIVYVGCTRARNRCFHIGSVDTVNKIIKKKANMKRHTFMQQMLKECVDNMKMQNTNN